MISPWPVADRGPLDTDPETTDDDAPGLRPAPPRPLGIRKPLALVGVEAVRPLHRPGSTKPTVLIELAAEPGELAWEPGDSLGVFPQNDPSETTAALRLFDGRRDAADIDAEALRAEVRDFLEWQADVRGSDRRLLEALSRRAIAPELRATVDAGMASRDALKQIDVQDLARSLAAGTLAGEGAVELFRRQTPRLYTIAGEGRSAEGDPTIELAVARMTWNRGDAARHGVASAWLADRVRPGTRFWAFVQPNKRFRFDASPDVPQIFVGPGTGIAPFRAELQRRGRLGVAGPTWLFFGARHRTTDHWFEQELRGWLAGATLSRYDAVFSRDGSDTKYVQHRLAERSEEVFAWLERGAVVSICGSARMAPEVERTLAEIVANEASTSLDAGLAYVAAMRAAGRLRTDVY